MITLFYVLLIVALLYHAKKNFSIETFLIMVGLIIALFIAAIIHYPYLLP